MPDQSRTHIWNARGRGFALKMAHNISSMERAAPKFIHVVTSAAKQCVTVTADRLVTEKKLQKALCQAVIALGCPALGMGTLRPWPRVINVTAWLVTSHILQNSVNSYLQRCLERITNEIIVALYIWLHGGCQKFVCYFPSKWVPTVYFPNKKKVIAFDMLLYCIIIQS